MCRADVPVYIHVLLCSFFRNELSDFKPLQQSSPMQKMVDHLSDNYSPQTTADSEHGPPTAPHTATGEHSVTTDRATPKLMTTTPPPTLEAAVDHKDSMETVEDRATDKPKSKHHKKDKERKEKKKERKHKAKAHEDKDGKDRRKEHRKRDHDGVLLARETVTPVTTQSSMNASTEPSTSTQNDDHIHPGG